MAHVRSVHFPLGMGAGDPSLHREEASRAKSSTPKPSILVVGEIGRDHVVLAEKLKTHHHDESAYHGNLQVMLSAVRRMETGLMALIREVEGGE
jgi:hypothetical protein